MNLANEFIGGQWLLKTAKSLSHEPLISNLATFQHFESEFSELFSNLATKQGWDSGDYGVWREDLRREPKNTIDVLRALSKSWQDGKYGVL